MNILKVENINGINLAVYLQEGDLAYGLIKKPIYLNLPFETFCGRDMKFEIMLNTGLVELYFSKGIIINGLSNFYYRDSDFIDSIASLFKGLYLKQHTTSYGKLIYNYYIKYNEFDLLPEFIYFADEIFQFLVLYSIQPGKSEDKTLPTPDRIIFFQIVQIKVDNNDFLTWIKEAKI